MPTRPSSSQDDLTFQQQRGKMVGPVLIALAFVALGTFFVLNPEAWRSSRHSPEWVETLGWITTGFFSCVLAVGILTLVMPATVRLGPEGLVIRTFRRTYSRPWASLSNFRVVTTRGSQIIAFDETGVRGGPTGGEARTATRYMPPMLNADAAQILDAVSRAKAGWDRASSNGP
jgi:hypothetical protein